MKIFFSAALAAVIGLAAGWLLFAEKPSAPASNKASAPQPLYWVAPMDSSYRRDGPGKSPMGMDLVPVYADDTSVEPGDVSISPSVQQQLGVKTVAVERRALTPALDAVGFVSFDEQALMHMHLRATGWVSGLAVNSVGDPVSRGQKLFDFYSPDIRNTQQEFLQALASDNSRLTYASREKLRAQGVPDSEIEVIERTGKIKSEVSYYAPQAGVVASLSVANGSYVTLQQNAMSIGPLNQVWVIAEVFERQAGLLQKGQPVRLSSRAYPGEQWRGEIDYVYPVLEAGNRTTRARIVVANKDERLKPNMLVDIQIDAASFAPALVVPHDAVIRTGRGDRVVREISPGVFRTQAVKSGASASGYTQILDGLSEGDRVVTRAQFLIDSESSVHVELDRLNADAVPPEKAGSHAGMDHSAMQHGERNHNATEHKSMSHAHMDHSTMNPNHAEHESMDHSGHSAPTEGEADHD